MNPSKAYKFCPRCSGDLIWEKENLLICKNCNFKFYINQSPCNAVIIENEKKEIMLVKRKFDPMKGYWDLPGGFMNAYESLQDSVKREIKEELGVEINLGKIIGVYKDIYVFQNIANPVIGIVVLAKIKKGIIKVSDDISTYKYFPKDKVLKQKLAFPSIKQGVSDYLKNKVPMP